jgi:hypothetical protein
VSCWADIAAWAVNVIASIGLNASRTGRGWAWGASLVPDAIGRQLTSNVMLALAVAILFARPEIRQAFARAEAPFTQ